MSHCSESDGCLVNVFWAGSSGRYWWSSWDASGVVVRIVERREVESLINVIVGGTIVNGVIVVLCG